MAKHATVKRRKAETPEAVKAKGPTKEVVEKATSTALIPVLKTGAMSVDVGPRVIKVLASAAMDDRQIKELSKSLEAKRYDALSNLTMAIVKAAKADNSITLSAVFGTSKLEQAKLNNQIGLALGFRQVFTVGKEGAEKKRVDWAVSVADYVKPNKDDPDDLGRQKGTVRSNFLHMLKKCMQTAVGLIDDKVDLKMDKATGTLLIAGPAVKSHFGAASVLLNEKQNVQTTDKKGNVTGETKLKVKPSFTEIARRAAESHGMVHAKRVDSRTTTHDPAKYVAELCAMLVKAIEKLGDEPGEAVTNALASARSAIDKVLD